MPTKEQSVNVRGAGAPPNPPGHRLCPAAPGGGGQRGGGVDWGLAPQYHRRVGPAHRPIHRPVTQTANPLKPRTTGRHGGTTNAANRQHKTQGHVSPGCANTRRDNGTVPDHIGYSVPKSDAATTRPRVLRALRRFRSGSARASLSPAI